MSNLKDTLFKLGVVKESEARQLIQILAISDNVIPDNILLLQTLQRNLETLRDTKIRTLVTRAIKLIAKQTPGWINTPVGPVPPLPQPSVRPLNQCELDLNRMRDEYKLLLESKTC